MRPASLEIICNTSPLQYLHQLGLLEILPALATSVLILNEVADELARGRADGWNVPDLALSSWPEVRRCAEIAHTAFPRRLARGEVGVLRLAQERPTGIAILDDEAARRAAQAMRIRFRGTLGLLIDAKKRGLVSSVAPLLDRLDELRFRVSTATRTAVLELAGE